MHSLSTRRPRSVTSTASFVSTFIHTTGTSTTAQYLSFVCTVSHISSNGSGTSGRPLVEQSWSRTTEYPHRQSSQRRSRRLLHLRPCPLARLKRAYHRLRLLMNPRLRCPRQIMPLWRWHRRAILRRRSQVSKRRRQEKSPIQSLSVIVRTSHHH